jgi:hypothetical protein
MPRLPNWQELPFLEGCFRPKAKAVTDQGLSVEEYDSIFWRWRRTIPRLEKKVREKIRQQIRPSAK